MKVFLTGATGVIGRRVTPQLVNAGHGVTAIARTPAKRDALERTGARARDVSLFNLPALRDAIEGHDVVVNLATHMPVSSLRILLPGAWHENDLVRREGSRNLVDAAIACRVQRFVQESFAPVYADRGSAWIHESDPIRPVAYNRTVTDAERSAERFAGPERVGVVLRFAAFYGPDARFMQDTANLVRRGFAPFPGPPHVYVSSVSHDDAATAVMAALDLPSGTYNVADDDPVTHRDYFDALADALGVASPMLPPAWATPLFGSLGHLIARSLRISNRKLRDSSGWRPRYPSVHEGFQALAASWRTSTHVRGHAHAP